MSDFSQSMAQMIAQARPQQAPSPGHVSVSSAPISGEQKMIQAHVDLGPWLQLFGVKTPQEKEQLVSDFRKMREAYGDKDWEKIQAAEPTQKILKSMYKTGYSGIIIDDNGRYNLPRMTEEARIQMGDASAPKIAAGGFGEQARQNLVRSEKESKGLSVEQLLSGEGGDEKRRMFLEGQRAMKAPTPEETALIQAQTEAQRQAGLVHAEQAKLLPEEFAVKKQESEVNRSRMMQEAEVFKAHAALYNSQTALAQEGLDKDTIDSIQQLNRQYAAYEQAWMEKHVYDRTETDAYKRNMELIPQVMSYVAGMKAVTTRPKHYEPAIRSWFSHVDPEFDREFAGQPTTVWGQNVPLTGSAQEEMMQLSRRKQYIKAGVSMLQQSGSRAHDLGSNLLLWTLKSGMGMPEVKAVLTEAGFSNEDIVKIAEQSALRFQ